MLPWVVLSAAAKAAPSQECRPYMLGTGLILYFLSKEIYVITPETFSAISIVGLLIYVIKIYGASIGEFIDEQKIAPLEEVKQTSIKQIQDAIELEKSLQALVQKRHYLFDVQRNNIAMALEVTYQEWLHKVYKEVKNHLDYHISVQNMMHPKEQEHVTNWVEKHVVQSISVQQEKEMIVKCNFRSPAARKEVSSTASYVNVSVSVETATHN
uniref:ATP synthase subunit b n=1 Tax=Marmota marmota marmota TaxID=9994 RepID=A0A8C5YTY8_MARMA